jgi:hypothetical protein
MDLSTLADYGIVTSSILARFRETHDASRKIARLKLFGPDADATIKEEDESLVRIFKEWGQMYAKAKDAGDDKGAREVLAGLTKLHLGWGAKEESVLGQCVKIQIKAAELQAKSKNGGGLTEAELVAAAGEEDG